MIIVTIPQAGLPWLSSNATTNRHWRHRQQVTKAWRKAAAWIARVDRVQPFHRPVHITGTIHRANRQVWDVDGAVVTIKAAIDGLRDAGVLAGDDHRYVRSVTSEWGEPDPDAPRLVLAISEVEAVA